MMNEKIVVFPDGVPRKILRDVYTGHLFLNLNDEKLYRSTTNGKRWELIACDGDFAWAVDANGRTHVAWKDPRYTTSYNKKFAEK